ncbi:MAG: universal stress protein [Gammaproteobacteria bacterium]|nr:universal stress protein [Gammaproteobacteria bacterium]
MLQFIPVNEKNIFAVRATGTLTHADYQAFLPELEDLISQHGKISLLIECESFSGWDLAAIKDDVQFSLKHKHDFEKIALVGNKAWHQWMALMAKPFVQGEIKYFSSDELQTAWDWLRDNQQQPAPSVDASPLKPYQHIIVAVDFSPHSEKAAYRAIQLAEQSGAHLTMLTVVDDVEFYFAYLDPLDANAITRPYDPELTASLAKSAHKIAQDNLNNLVEKTQAKNAETEISIGSPSTSIISYVEATNCDLLVMGTHGRRGFSRLLGSTAHSVQNHARCEVLMVPLDN